MRVLNTQEMLIVTGAGCKGRKPVATPKPLPLPLPKIDLAGLLAKLKAHHATRPTKPTTPATDDTTTDTSTDDTTDTSTDVVEA